MGIAKYADGSSEEFVRGGRIRQNRDGSWRVSGDYMYRGRWIENIPSRELAEQILAALDDTADSVRDDCDDSYSSV